MPNHFHFLIGTTPFSVEKVKVGNAEITRLHDGLRILQSSYTRGINQQNDWSGSLFRQKTKAKCLTEEAFDYDDPSLPLAPDFLNLYPLVCFHYIHQNPWKAGLVNAPEDWEFSSFRDHLGSRNGKLCNFDLTRRWVGVRPADLDDSNLIQLKSEEVKLIFVN